MYKNKEACYVALVFYDILGRFAVRTQYTLLAFFFIIDCSVKDALASVIILIIAKKNVTSQHSYFILECKI